MELWVAARLSSSFCIEQSIDTRYTHVSHRGAAPSFLHTWCREPWMTFLNRGERSRLRFRKSINACGNCSKSSSSRLLSSAKSRGCASSPVTAILH